VSSHSSGPVQARTRGFTALTVAVGIMVSLSLAPAASAAPDPDDVLAPSIIGGTNAVISDAPWQVGLVYLNASSDYQGQFCGGSLVSSWEIVTAAHCIDSSGDVLTTADIGVMIGRATLSTTARTALPLASITVHPGWDKTTNENDIAVLRLAAPVALIPGLQEAITLPASSPADGTSALITGWGNTSTSGTSYPTQLKRALVTTVSDSSCDTAYGGINAEVMLCATGSGFTTDTCQGDSGGPLAVESGGVWQLAGVTSFGIGCAEAPYPGVYAEVSAFTTWLDAQLTAGPQVVRIAGASRYSTAIAISKAGFPDPVTSVPVVFVASGTNFPDALSAGPAAANLGGPLLLTSPSALPSEVTAEINRLNPDKIVVVGGTGSVSASVYSALSGLAPEIVRLGGADRYATSLIVSEYAFESEDTDTAFVADGAGFADALAAGAAAGAYDAPVVLVRGISSSVSTAARNYLEDLGLTQIFAVGGASVISPSMLASLGTIAATERLWGADRIATAVDVNDEAFDSSEFVYLSNAFSFPDALAGGVLATRQPGPLFTVPANCVPTSVLSAITALGATEVRLLGGAGILTVRVAALRTC